MVINPRATPENAFLHVAALPLSADEALEILRAATARGMELGDFIAAATLAAMEEDDREPYRDRAYTLEDLDEVADTLEYHEGQAAQIRADLEAGTFPESNGWLPGTTADGAREELAFHEEGIAKANKEKTDLLSDYAATLEDGDALGILEDYLEEKRAWKYGGISRAAKRLRERKNKK
jgi:hypothetical protein